MIPVIKVWIDDNRQIIKINQIMNSINNLKGWWYVFPYCIYKDDYCVHITEDNSISVAYTVNNVIQDWISDVFNHSTLILTRFRSFSTDDEYLELDYEINKILNGS